MQNFLDPAILFFVFGVIAGALRSNLEIPAPIAKFLSLYLLMALGLKGGFALAASGLTLEILLSLLAAMLMAILVPLLGYALLRHKVSGFDAAALAASYGSVSAVTFVTAIQSLEDSGLRAGGHMAMAMVLMESPAIIVAIVIGNALRKARNAPSRASATVAAMEPVPGTATVAAMEPVPGTATVAAMEPVPATAPVLSTASVPVRAPDRDTTPVNAPNPKPHSIGAVLHESFTSGAHLLLLGSMLVGLLSGESGKSTMQPFSSDLFKGMLAFFLLDMGLMVARNFGDARKAPAALLGYAVLAPFVHAGMALALARALGLTLSDGFLLMVLSASASYIVVPAVLRDAIPEANPAIYFGLSLGITFPLNILLGIPVYSAAARALLG